MPNIKSAKKRAKQEVVRHARNVTRISALKTSVKRVRQATEQGLDAAQLKELLNDAQAKLARAAGKGVIHARTAARKISRLAKRVAQATTVQQ